MKSNKFLLVFAIILIAAIFRLIPHPYNFTPIGAMALFSGYSFKDKKYSFLLPLIPMFLTDFILGFHSTMFAVYFSFFFIVYLGIVLEKKYSHVKLIGFSLLSSFVFFFITNLFVWLTSGVYVQDFSGLINCYVSAIPFFENSIFGNFFLNTVLSDLFYNGIVFFSFFSINKKIEKSYINKNYDNFEIGI